MKFIEFKEQWKKIAELVASKKHFEQLATLDSVCPEDIAIAQEEARECFPSQEDQDAYVSKFISKFEPSEEQIEQASLAEQSLKIIDEELSCYSKELQTLCSSHLEVGYSCYFWPKQILESIDSKYNEVELTDAQLVDLCDMMPLHDAINRMEEKLKAIATPQERYKVSHLIPVDFAGNPVEEMLDYIPDTLEVVEEYNNSEPGYIVVEAEYDDLGKVSYYDEKEHKTYYLDTYFKAVGSDGNEVICGRSFSPNKEDCLLQDVSMEMMRKNRGMR